MKFSRYWLWLLLAIPVGLGLTRVRLDTEMLNLLPPEEPVVQGLKLYQKHFANARELIILVNAPTAELAEEAVSSIASNIPPQLVTSVTWQAPWLNNPGQAAELLAYLWLNQSPEVFNQLTNRLAPEHRAATLERAREKLATSFSPAEIGGLSYDPYGLMNLPDGAGNGFAAGGQGPEMFASSDGTGRIIFVQSSSALATYPECAQWLGEMRQSVDKTLKANQQFAGVKVEFTGRPAIVAEIASGMEREVKYSVIGTGLIIAVLFYIAHRRVRPMLWLLILLALILASTFALGGLIFGTINVVSMGFAAILLGLAVDYAVVHYQEALAHPDLSIPQIRGAIGPSIFWAAFTTVTAFLVLNVGGLPGLGQLGSLVAIGVVLSALVMLFAYLPPLFPNRMRAGATTPVVHPAAGGSIPIRCSAWPMGVSALLMSGALLLLLRGIPGFDNTPSALRPRNSPSYEALERMKTILGMEQEPLWLIISGRNEGEVYERLSATETALGKFEGLEFLLPTALWPRPEFQRLNSAVAAGFANDLEGIKASAVEGGFTTNSVALAGNILQVWQDASTRPGTYWPTNGLSQWILGKAVARTESEGLFVMGMIYPPKGESLPPLAVKLIDALPNDGVLLSGWDLLGSSIFAKVRGRLWLIVCPMLALVLLSLLLAFRSWREVSLSIAAMLLSALILLAVMQMMAWKWNLMNLMAIPLVLGTGVDYSIFMQLALRRYGGDAAMAYKSVGRALLLCGGTAVAGFGSLSWSSNAGMASLGAVCAIAIAANTLISVFLLPAWWQRLRKTGHASAGKI